MKCLLCNYCNILGFLLHRLEDAVDLLNLDLMVNPESEFAVQARDLQNVDLAKVNKLIDFVLAGFFSSRFKRSSTRVVYVFLKILNVESLFQYNFLNIILFNKYPKYLNDLFFLFTVLYYVPRITRAQRTIRRTF